MPELPEVETVVRALCPILTGRVFGRPKLLRASAAEGSPEPLSRLTGRRIVAVERRAKFLRLRLSGGMNLLIHLRMTGRLSVRPWPAEPGPHDRAVLPLRGGRGKKNIGGEALLFGDARTFGRLHLVRERDLGELPEWKKLGPEPFSLAAAEFTARLRTQKRRLKPLLLDQTFLAGLGNIYTDEALYAARLHPALEARRVTAAKAKTLFKEIEKVLRAAIAAGGTTVSDFVRPDGSEGLFRRKLRVYGRAGKPCRRCGKAIVRLVVGGRGTWICPNCQKPPHAP